MNKNKNHAKTRKEYKKLLSCEECVWRNSVDSEYPHTFLQRYEIEIPSGCKFMLLKTN